MHCTKPQPLAGAPREYRIVQDVPMLGLRAGDIVVYSPDTATYSLCRRLVADPLLLRATLGEVSLFIEPALQPMAVPTPVIPFPAKPKARGGAKPKRTRKAAP